jgi:hypothetical protein
MGKEKTLYINFWFSPSAFIKNIHKEKWDHRIVGVPPESRNDWGDHGWFSLATSDVPAKTLQSELIHCYTAANNLTVTHELMEAAFA